MLAHLPRISAVVLVILAFRFLPFLPGRYDRLALTLSMMAQLFALAGLVLVPIGALWLVYEIKIRGNKAYYFALSALVASSLITFTILLLAMFESISLAFGLLVLWVYFLVKTAPRLKLFKQMATRPVSSAPLYLLCVPLAVAAVQWMLIEPATEYSRNYIIQRSQPLINDLQAYHRANGRYPLSLHALVHDYEPVVIGVERFHYFPSGEAYNLYFEHLAVPIGTKEIVMYNNRDEHFFGSHDSDILLWTPEQLRARRTYYALQDTAVPHWKYFWFD